MSSSLEISDRDLRGSTLRYIPFISQLELDFGCSAMGGVSVAWGTNVVVAIEDNCGKREVVFADRLCI